MNELLQQRIQAVQIGRNTTFAQMEQKKSLQDELDSQLEAFLSNGGAIEQLPQGFRVNTTRAGITQSQKLKRPCVK